MHYDNKDYYFGQEYVKRSPDDHICSYDYQELMKQTAPPAGTTVNATAEENNKALAQVIFRLDKFYNAVEDNGVSWSGVCQNLFQKAFRMTKGEAGTTLLLLSLIYPLSMNRNG